MRYLLAAILILAFPVLADAQDGGGINWRSVRQKQWVCRDWGGCGYEWRYVRRRVYDAPRYYAAPREREFEPERLHHCVDSVKAVGVEKYGTARAKESADASWMETVRASPGAKYMDLRNAKRVTYECWQSSTGNRASEKAADVGGKYLEQCEVRAHPCRAPKTEGSGDDR
jgi:hypothetical protein